MEATELCNELQEYSDLNDVLLRMSSTGNFNRFQDLVIDLYKHEYNTLKEHPYRSKDHIKTILYKIIDQVWQDHFSKFGPKRDAIQIQPRELNHIPEISTPTQDEDTIETKHIYPFKKHKPENSRKTSKVRRNKLKSNTSRITLETPSSSSLQSPGQTSNPSFRYTISKSRSSSILSRAFEDISRFSEFAHIHSPGSFSKSPRNIGSPKNLSPGPAAYKVDLVLNRPSSPRVVIGSSGRRHGYLGKNVSPGPNKYYPMKYCISKY